MYPPDIPFLELGIAIYTIPFFWEIFLGLLTSFNFIEEAPKSKEPFLTIAKVILSVESKFLDSPYSTYPVFISFTVVVIEEKKGLDWSAFLYSSNILDFVFLAKFPLAVNIPTGI